MLQLELLKPFLTLWCHNYLTAVFYILVQCQPRLNFEIRPIVDEGVRFNYCKVASSRLSWLVAHFWIFRLIMKGEFDNYVLWPLAQRVQNSIVDRSTCRDFTVFEEWWYIQIQAHIEGINIGLTTWMVSRKIVSWNQKKRVCVSLLIIFGMLLWVYYGFKQN